MATVPGQLWQGAVGFPRGQAQPLSPACFSTSAPATPPSCEHSPQTLLQPQLGFEPSTPRDAGSHSAPELGKKKTRLLPRTSSEKLHLLFSLPSCSKRPRPFPKQRRGRVALRHKIPKCCFLPLLKTTAQTVTLQQLCLLAHSTYPVRFLCNLLVKTPNKSRLQIRSAFV